MFAWCSFYTDVSQVKKQHIAHQKRCYRLGKTCGPHKSLKAHTHTVGLPCVDQHCVAMVLIVLEHHVGLYASHSHIYIASVWLQHKHNQRNCTNLADGHKLRATLDRCILVHSLHQCTHM